MRVLLVFPSTGYYTSGLATPLGLLSIGTYLEQFGHEVMLYDRCMDTTKMKKVFHAFSPEIVGISLMSSRGLKDAFKISKYAKDRGLPVIWGGQLPSLQIDLVLQSPYVDMVSFGEGEETWAELLECLDTGDFSDVLGLAYKKEGKIITNPCRPFMDLAKLPATDWSLIDVSKYTQPYLANKKMMYVCSSKGCPARCAFCVNVNFHKSTYRKRPTEIVLQEIRYLIEHYGVDSIYFSDELWSLTRSDAREFCQRILDEGLQFHWGVDTRIDLLREEDYRLMYQAGCRWLLFGIECGSEEMRRRVHKNINYDKVNPTLDLLNEIGFTTITSFIVGFPDETKEQLQDTINMIKNIHSGLTPIFHFWPIPGTELYNYLVQQGRYHAPEKIEDLFGSVATINLGTNYSCVTDRELKVIKNWFVWKSFTSKNAINNGKSFEFAKSTIKDGLRAISTKGIISFFVNGFAALNEFLYIFYYAHRYPEIRKKYDLQ